MLNHGSFGACPLAVLVFQQTLRRQMEREPVRFLTREMTPLLDESRQTLAARIGADPANLVFVRNATSAVNSVLRSLEFAPGDEILVTNHGYNACRNVVDYIAGRSNARVVTAEIPFPCIRLRRSFSRSSPRSPSGPAWRSWTTSRARRPSFFPSSSWCGN